MKRGMKLIENFIWMQAVVLVGLISCVAIWPEQHKVFAIVGGVMFVPLFIMAIVGMTRERKYMNSLMKEV